MELVSTYICKTSDIGVHSNMFGGTLVFFNNVYTYI